MPRETWYVLEDGTVADPREVVSDGSGKLFHKSGLAVAMRGDTPSSRGVDVPDDQPRARDRDMKPAAGAKYKTR